MNWHLELVTPDTAYPVTLDETRQHLGVAAGDDDDRLQTYIAAVTAWAEKAVRGGIAIMTQTWDYKANDFPRGSSNLTLPNPPLQSVTSVTYFDTSGTQQTLIEGTDFRVLTPWKHNGFLEPIDDAYWPEVDDDRSDAVTIRFVAGYTSRSNVPENLKHAIKMMISHWNENREAVITGTIATEIPQGVEALMRQQDVGFYG
jgi:uncharacterized phiE125 gp8 family phage protein